MLLGALIGGVVFVGIEVAVAAATNKKLTAKQLLVAFGAGALGGLVGGALLGVGRGAVGVGQATVASAATGGVTAGSHRAGTNALEGRPIGDGVLRETAVGGTVGAVIPSAVRGAGKAVRGVADRVRGARTPAADGASRSASVGAADGVTAPAAKPTSPATSPATSPSAVRPAEGVDDLVPAPEALPPPSTGPPAAPGGNRGARGAMLLEEPGAARPTSARPSRSIRPYRSVHAAPPSWLARRFERTVAAVRNGQAGPKADPEDVRAFLHETYEHVNEVNALMRAMGVRPRAIPTAEPSGALRGVHDFGERVSLRRLEQFVDDLRRNPLTDRDGVPLEVPAWLAELPRKARAAGETTVDVGKMSPHVAAGLGRSGPPDPFAIKLHNLSGHHGTSWANAGRSDRGLVEAVADKINAMRQVRIYRPEPLPFAKIRAILLEDIDRGVLPPRARDLIDRGLLAQDLLERTGRVNPYHLVEAVPAGG
jgi:hypothetical protein